MGAVHRLSSEAQLAMTAKNGLISLVFVALYLCISCQPCQGDDDQQAKDLFKRETRKSFLSYFWPTYNRRAVEEEPYWWYYNKRAPGSEFLGKRAPGSEFLGKRVPGSEFLGKRVPGSEFLGKRVPGSEFLGKRVPGSEFLGKRVPGSEFLGKRVPGSEFLGKRVPGSEFLGKRIAGSEFLGKRSSSSSHEEEIPENEVEELLDILRHQHQQSKRSLEVPLSVEQRNDRNRFEST